MPLRYARPRERIRIVKPFTVSQKFSNFYERLSRRYNIIIIIYSSKSTCTTRHAQSRRFFGVRLREVKNLLLSIPVAQVITISIDYDYQHTHFLMRNLRWDLSLYDVTNRI